MQECIDGFTRNWETRVFWFNGEFLHLSSIGPLLLFHADLDFFALSQVRNCQQGSCFNGGHCLGPRCNSDSASCDLQDGTEVIVTGCFSYSLSFSIRIPWAGDDIPEEFLENAKRIGKEALKARVPVLGNALNSTYIELIKPQDQQCQIRRFCRSWPLLLESPFQWTLACLVLMAGWVHHDVRTLIRTDIGCSDSKVFDKDLTWPDLTYFYHLCGCDNQHSASAPGIAFDHLF